MAERVSNIGAVVDSVMNQMQDYGMGSRDKAMLENIAVSFYSDRLRAFHAPSVVSAEIKISLGTRVWTFPPDYVKYTKIAYKVAGSNWPQTLGLNNEINISGSLASCEQPISETAPVTGEGFWFSQYGTGGNTLWQTPLYAVGGGFSENYYRVDYENRCIRFLENLPVGMGYIEYLSSGKDVGAHTLVPLGYRAAFESWLIVRICQMKPRVMALAKMAYADFKDDHMRRMWDANLLIKGLSDQEESDAIYRGSGYTIR